MYLFFIGDEDLEVISSDLRGKRRAFAQEAVWESKHPALFWGVVVGGGLCYKGRRVEEWRSASTVGHTLQMWCLPRVVASSLFCAGAQTLCCWGCCLGGLCPAAAVGRHTEEGQAKKGCWVSHADGDVQGGSYQGHLDPAAQAASLATCPLSFLWVGSISGRIFPPGGRSATSGSQCPSCCHGHCREDAALPRQVPWLCLAQLGSWTPQNQSVTVASPRE